MGGCAVRGIVGVRDVLNIVLVRPDLQARRVIDGLLTGQPLARAQDEATAHLGLPKDILLRRREKRRRK